MAKPKQAAACWSGTSYILIVVFSAPSVRFYFKTGHTWIERSADHAREDDEDEGQQFQIGGEDRCSFYVTHVFGR